MEGLDGHAKVEFEGLIEDFFGCCSRFSAGNGEEEWLLVCSLLCVISDYKNEIGFQISSVF